MASATSIVGSTGGGPYFTDTPPPPAAAKLSELIRSEGFQNANDAEKRAMLKDMLKDVPEQELKSLLNLPIGPGTRECVEEVLQEKESDPGDEI